MLRFIKKNKFQILKFLIVGLLSSTLNFFIYSLVYYLTFKITFASISGYLIGLANSFYFSSKWIFTKTRKKRFNYTFIVFMIIYIIGGLEMTLIINIVNAIVQNPYIAWLCGALIAAVNNYLCSKYLVFGDALE